MSTWTDEGWRQRAEAWIAERLADLDRTITGPIEQTKPRPWGTLLRVPTSSGTVWFKANAAGTAYEVPLTVTLGRWRARGTVAPLAVDDERAWMLLPDAGTPLRETEVVDLDTWLDFLPEYARLQLDLLPHTEELLALGVPDFRPTTLPYRLKQLLDSPEWLGVGTYGPTVEEHQRLATVVAHYERRCAELDQLGIPSTLQHDDMHDGNVFVTAEGGFAFLDWGDAIVGHPYGSLYVARQVAARRLGLDPLASELDKLRDAYLEPWTERYDRADLTTAVDLALDVVRIGRMFTLNRAFLTATESDMQPYQEWYGRWFGDILDVEPDTDRTSRARSPRLA